MPVATEKPGPQARSILSSTGNRVRFHEEQRTTKTDMAAKKPKKVISKSPAAAVVRCNASAQHSSTDSSTSSSSSSSRGSNVKPAKCAAPERLKGGNKAAKIAPDGFVSLAVSPAVPVPVKRCEWITPNSEPPYTSFHDEEWGVPVHEDNKLFEPLVLSQALAELSWPVILSKRDIFRKLFEDFNPKSVADLDEERLVSMRVNGGTLLSEPKLRAVVDNAKQLLKIQQEFGSFSNYCWRFVNHKPMKSGFRYARRVPAKTPKSELMSKDMMQRGFRCVGPTVVYSFMQVAGLVNDHLVTCFRYNECNNAVIEKEHPRPDPGTKEMPKEEEEEAAVVRAKDIHVR